MLIKAKTPLKSHEKYEQTFSFYSSVETVKQLLTLTW